MLSMSELILWFFCSYGMSIATGRLLTYECVRLPRLV